MSPPVADDRALQRIMARDSKASMSSISHLSFAVLSHSSRMPSYRSRMRRRTWAALMGRPLLLQFPLMRLVPTGLPASKAVAGQNFEASISGVKWCEVTARSYLGRALLIFPADDVRPTTSTGCLPSNSPIFGLSDAFEHDIEDFATAVHCETPNPPPESQVFIGQCRPHSNICRFRK
ncbi:hypothetical protein BS47DRAFT_1394609 [Hydnum rufescens UP504]|uniref:Uncharacterized protein n=1 Tax=Hydnum rufescens UP504 TaxID=1448309 RepID=A0A9P6ATS4_9AGAM|nr:hypothetical protein BS47DRAFT_1394609 [Hydnum rufescens UP504]